jgi:hypothetical protein
LVKPLNQNRMEEKLGTEWLVEQLNLYEYEDVIKQAKEMEKNNVCNAWDDGYDKGMRDRIEKISNPVGNAEQYYNKNFKSE